MKIEVRNRCSDYDSYRAARVKSLFNAETGANFDLDAILPEWDEDWQLGVVVGPSGSGKSSIGRQLAEQGATWWEPDWPTDRPIVDAIAPDGDFDAVTGALAAVGLGTVPTWLRPFQVTSMGEQFRANMARLIAEAPDRVVLDEFTSVVDRQIARMGALAFGKAWRRTGKQAVLLTCHHDVLEWLEPDWIYDTGAGSLARDRLRRPTFDVEIYRADHSYWPLFEPHHYLKLSHPIGGKTYLAVVDGEPVAHVVMATKNKGKTVEARGTRLVVLPEWQGAGVGMRFLNAVCQANLEGAEWARLPGRNVTTIFHTSHPGLVQALKRDRRWHHLTAILYGASKARSQKHMLASSARSGKLFAASGYGGHFRAVQGFRYVGAPPS